MLLLVDHVDLVEAIGQIRRLAHVVDRLADGEILGHGDELGLHPPAGGILRIKQAALERDAFGQRQLLQDLFLVRGVESLQELDRVVGFELANALGDRFRRQLLEDLLAHRLVDLVQRREVEIASRQLDQADTVVGFERPDQIAEIGLVQLADDGPEQSRVAGFDRARNLLDEFVPNFALFIAHRHVVEYRGRGGWGNVHLFIHGAPRRLTGGSGGLGYRLRQYTRQLQAQWQRYVGRNGS